VTYPIPDAALDDRLAIVGTSGSGKTHAACTGVERLLEKRARVVVIDPLDVWYGLRLKQDGVRPAFPVVIFGGARGDVPITEAAGAIIGETIATMAESCVVSLASLGSKAAERRFMLALLDRLYRRAAGEPLHIVIDEADLFAPQKGGEPQLQNLMENIVRRGRVRGFIPWLITQRPAVLSKDVLSQADGLIAMKLTLPHDINAVGSWIEGQADKAQEKRILARLPQLERGQGVLWIPGREILTEVHFPQRTTYDSSRTPKRGEPARAAVLKPIDLGAVKTLLASLETVASGNDPKALKREIAALRAQLATGGGPAAHATQVQIDAAEQRAYERGFAEGSRQAAAATSEADRLALEQFISAHFEQRTERVARPVAQAPAEPAPEAPRPKREAKAPTAAGELDGPEKALLAALAWWKAVGQSQPSRAMACAIVGWRVTAGHIRNKASSLNTLGLITYPSPGRRQLTAEGAKATGLPIDFQFQKATAANAKYPGREHKRISHGDARRA
jgi:hypothetical protein